MNRAGFVKRALVAFGLVVLSFFVRGFSQLLFGRGVADVLQAPLAVIGFVLLVYLFVRATLDVIGVWSIKNPKP
jgi:TM2 domain-containing membrane protein YozV